MPLMVWTDNHGTTNMQHISHMLVAPQVFPISMY